MAVAAGIGGDILDAAALGDDQAAVGRFDEEQLDFMWRCAKLVVVRGGGGEGGLVVGDETEAGARFFEG